jgi:uncharacterized zinc-type alcohol dehydrogenase-like protein
MGIGENDLAFNGALGIVGASPGELRVPVCRLLEGQKSIGGSAIGSNAEMRAMLEFAAAHAVQPRIGSYSMSAINDMLNGCGRIAATAPFWSTIPFGARR